MCIHCDSLCSSASLTYDSFLDIVDRIKKNDKTLTCVRSVETDFGWKAAKIIAEAMMGNIHVIYLRLGNKIGDVGAEAFARMLEHNTTLKVLDLSCNISIAAPGVTFLANALKNNTTLTTLILSETNVKQKACVVLSRMLAVNKTLTTLDISGNNFGDNGVKALLNSNHSLTILSIANNKITSVGAKIIANTILNNNILQRLDVRNNNFEDSGNQALLDALEYNYSLTTFKSNIITSKYNFILNHNKNIKLYITIMLLLSACEPIIRMPSLIVKRIVDDATRMMNF